MSSLRVLVVDDEIELANTLAERLELRDIHAEFVTTRREALARIRKQAYDVIVLDMVLQRARGLDVLREIRNLRPNQPVILMSGRGSDQDCLEGKRQGAFDYLIKPVQIEDLVNTMKRATEEARKGGGS